MGTRAIGLALVFALAGCPTVDLGDTPADINSCRPDRGYFDSTLWPNYVATAARGCINEGGCHDNQNSPRSALRFQTNPLDLRANYNAITRFLNCGSPDASEALVRPLRLTNNHPIAVFTMSDSEYQTFLAWFDL